jgi:hypothetical protein
MERSPLIIQEYRRFKELKLHNQIKKNKYLKKNSNYNNVNYIYKPILLSININNPINEYNPIDNIKNSTKNIQQIDELKKIYYKSCGEYIILLKKYIDTITNENRLNIYDIENASYRANKMFIYDIIHKINPDTKINKLYNTIYHKKILYEKGKIVECTDYDYNINHIYTTGIHYYKNKERALYDEPDILIKIKYSGNHTEYNEYGEKLQEGQYLNGNKIGKWIFYHTYNLNENEISFLDSLYLFYYKIKKQSIKFIKDY